MCKCFKVSKNAFYSWIKDKKMNRLNDNKTSLQKMIQKIFDDSQQVYGSYRIKAELERQGVLVSRPYVARLMKNLGLKSVLGKKFKVTTTDSKHDYPVAENILNRNFCVQELGKVWVSDITYIKVGNKWGYLTVIIDLADRKVVGWSLSDDMTYENTIMRAWVMARNNRKIIKGFIFHSDRGSQYACNKMRSIFSFQLKPAAGELKKQSMSRKGNCWDNAVAESFFKSIKYESINRYNFNNFNQLYVCVINYIYWYNTKRIHSSLGYMTPLEKEREIKSNYKHRNVA
jgi:transposase InsO family protein